MPSRRDLLSLAPLLAMLPALGVAAQPPSATPAPRPLRLLILGGTGFIGPHQVRYALARGHKVTLFNRGDRRIDWPGAVEELSGDRNKSELGALKGREWDVCIDNPTTLPFWVRDVGAILKDRVRHYILVSTVSAYASNADAGADEGAALAAYAGKDAMAETEASLRADMATLYGSLKAQSEREAERCFPGRASIVRPSLIVGPGDETDRFTYWPVRLARGGDVLCPGDGEDPVQFVDARDLAEWMVRLAEAPQPGAFNALGPDYTLSTAALLYGIRATTSAGARLRWAPTSFLEQHGVQAWSDLPVWVPGSGDSAGFARRSNRKAIAAGLRFRPLATTATDTLAWFRTLPAERQASLRAGLAPERERRLLAALAAA